MRKDVADPFIKANLPMHVPHDVKISKVMAKVHALSGRRYSRAGVIDHLLSNMDINATAAEIAAKVGK